MSVFMGEGKKRGYKRARGGAKVRNERRSKSRDPRAEIEGGDRRAEIKERRSKSGDQRAEIEERRWKSGGMGKGTYSDTLSGTSRQDLPRSLR
jgi:hypothetical protein